MVITRSGGIGTCSVSFKGDEVTQVLPKQTSAIFVDETHTFLTAWDKHRYTCKLITQSADRLFEGSSVQLKSAQVHVKIMRFYSLSMIFLLEDVIHCTMICWFRYIHIFALIK